MINDKERLVPMQVLVLSPPRTGTMSMHQALETLLQAPVYHGKLLMTRQQRTGGKFWLNCIEAKYEGKGRPYTRNDFDHGLGKFAGVTDMPCCFLWRELMDAYPEAKVVLVNRDVESWVKSFLTVAVTGGAFTLTTNLIVAMEPYMGSYTATMVQKQLLGYFGATNAWEIEQNARKVFHKHYQDIREACAATPGRLLEMNIEEGWTPLCKFLDLPVPSELFPSTNEMAMQQAKISEYKGEKFYEGALVICRYLAIPLVAGAVGLWYLTWRISSAGSADLIGRIFGY